MDSIFKLAKQWKYSGTKRVWENLKDRKLWQCSKLKSDRKSFFFLCFTASPLTDIKGNTAKYHKNKTKSGKNITEAHKHKGKTRQFKCLHKTSGALNNQDVSKVMEEQTFSSLSGCLETQSNAFPESVSSLTRPLSLSSFLRAKQQKTLLKQKHKKK